MKFITTAAVSLLVLFIGACTGGGSSAIKGKITGGEGQTIYLERLVNNRWGRTDSTVIAADGTFNMVPQQSLELDFYRVVLNDRDFIVLVADSTESIEINGEAGKLNGNATVKGSEQTLSLREFEKSVDKFFTDEEAALVALQTEASPERQAQLRDQVISIRKERTDHIKSWLQSNSATPPALAVVQMLDPKGEQATFRKVLDDLKPAMGHSMHYKLLKQQVDRYALKGAEPQDDGTPPGAKISVGNPVPDIVMPDPNGKVRKLSDLKGKVVLIDFWASWCGPCRRENPNVVEVYNKYKKEGFEVFSVSLDKSADPWKQAITQDKLTWPNHVSDLKFWESKAAQDYGVHSIPFPVLIDKEGKVIAFGNNIRGPLLESNLKQIFGR